MIPSYMHFEDLLYRRAASEGIPLAGEFELTARCNFSCKMCYVKKRRTGLPEEGHEYSALDWLRLAEAARDSGMLYLTLTGGEVLMRQDFWEIYMEAKRMGLIMTIFTNGSMITPELAKKLGQAPPLLVEVTLYGASPGTYSRICGNPAGFETAKRGIELLQAEGIDLSLKTTLIRDNAGDYDRIFDFADEHGIGLKHVKYISPHRDETVGELDECRLCPEEQASINLYASKRYNSRLSKKAEKDKHFNYDRHKDFKEMRKSLPFECASGSCCFWVTWDGRMTPCGHMNEPASRPFETGFEKAWEELKDSCRRIPSCKDCDECSLRKHCYPCPARLKNETGYFDRPAPYLCEMARAMDFEKGDCK